MCASLFLAKYTIGWLLVYLYAQDIQYILQCVPLMLQIPLARKCRPENSRGVSAMQRASNWVPCEGDRGQEARVNGLCLGRSLPRVSFCLSLGAWLFFS